MKPTDPLTVKNAKSYAKAKESYDAVINDAGRADWYCEPLPSLTSDTTAFPHQVYLVSSMPNC